jgi:hypothetical protein
MTRPLLKSLLATVAVAAFSFGTATLASAAPVTTAFLSSDAQAAPAHSLVQPVYWVWHHHHRHWVPNHYHH